MTVYFVGCSFFPWGSSSEMDKFYDWTYFCF